MTTNAITHTQLFPLFPSPAKKKRQALHSPADKVMGYMIAKSEGRGTDWHGHVSAVTVAAEYRRLGMAEMLMKFVQRISEM